MPDWEERVRTQLISVLGRHYIVESIDKFDDFVSFPVEKSSDAPEVRS